MTNNICNWLAYSVKKLVIVVLFHFIVGHSQAMRVIKQSTAILYIYQHVSTRYALALFVWLCNTAHVTLSPITVGDIITSEYADCWGNGLCLEIQPHPRGQSINLDTLTASKLFNLRRNYKVWLLIWSENLKIQKWKRLKNIK